ncbi:hypothetical protein [Leifsonia sp. P73]|uniref:hypothetical protein n=1 Tax=Leifsonia sp. P73 TaxID=3423959 RepID=UPI003DA66E15
MSGMLVRVQHPDIAELRREARERARPPAVAVRRHGVGGPDVAAADDVIAAAGRFHDF